MNVTFEELQNGDIVTVRLSNDSSFTGPVIKSSFIGSFVTKDWGLRATTENFLSAIRPEPEPTSKGFYIDIDGDAWLKSSNGWTPLGARGELFTNDSGLDWESQAYKYAPFKEAKVIPEEQDRRQE